MMFTSSLPEATIVDVMKASAWLSVVIKSFCILLFVVMVHWSNLTDAGRCRPTSRSTYLGGLFSGRLDQSQIQSAFLTIRFSTSRLLS